ncbi:hypothetical protein [Ligilactobacillus ruminis]|nr:hypothetical protein [Ligilactobacillus ruminis]
MKFLTKSVESRLDFAHDLVKILSRFTDKAAVFDGLSVNTSHAEQPGDEFPSELCILQHKKTSVV